MSLSNIFQISSQGMTAQRERLEASIANLANAHTTRTAEGGAYRRRDVLFEATTTEQGQSIGSLFDLSASRSAQPLPGVTAATLTAPVGAGIKQYQPGHPDADNNGYVTLPDIDPLEETVNMISATRSFEANATAFNTAKEMMRASLKLGEG